MRRKDDHELTPSELAWRRSEAMATTDGTYYGALLTLNGTQQMTEVQVADAVEQFGLRRALEHLQVCAIENARHATGVRQKDQANTVAGFALLALAAFDAGATADDRALLLGTVNRVRYTLEQLGVANAPTVDVASAIEWLAAELTELRGDARQVALMRVRAAGDTNRAVPCGHPDASKPEICIVCAYELGRRMGHVEAGAYLTHDEAVAEIRGKVAGLQRLSKPLTDDGERLPFGHNEIAAIVREELERKGLKLNQYDHQIYEFASTYNGKPSPNAVRHAFEREYPRMFAGRSL